MANARFAGFLILASLTAGAPALARSGNQIFMPGGMLADAPAGFVEMCVRDAALCMMGQSSAIPVPEFLPVQNLPLPRPDTLAPTGAAIMSVGPVQRIQPGGAVHLRSTANMSGAKTPRDHRALIKFVNSDVNRHVTQMSDTDAMGIGEYWRRLPTDLPVGDCEDIAIEKRARLTDAGFPADRMFYAVAFVRRLGLHTVLIARMDDGDYVLDSITPHIVRWEKSHYVWLRKQVPGSPLEWERPNIDNGPTYYAATATPDKGALPES